MHDKQTESSPNKKNDMLGHSSTEKRVMGWIDIGFFVLAFICLNPLNIGTGKPVDWPMLALFIAVVVGYYLLDRLGFWEWLKNFIFSHLKQ